MADLTQIPTDQLLQMLGSHPQAQQMTGVGRALALPASNLVKGAAQAADMFGGTPATIDPIANAVLSNSGVDLFKPADLAQTAAKNTGLIDRPDLTPQNETEKLVAAGAKGIGGALPLAFAGAPALALASGVGGGVGSELGEQAAPDHPIIGNLVGGLLGGATAGGIGSLAGRAANAALGNLNDVGQSYKIAGITPRLTGDVSGNPFLQKLQTYSMDNPGGMGRTRAAAEATIADFGKSVGDTAAQLGPSSSLDELGNNLQTQGGNWIKQFQGNNKMIWGAVDSKLAGAPVDLSPVKTVLSDITAKAGGNDAAEAFLKSPLAKQMESITDSGRVVPWETAQALRSRVGEYLENPALISDAGGAQAKRFYGAFSDAMKNTAAAHPDPNVATLFQKANAYTSQGHDFIESTLAPMMNKDPAKAAQSVLTGANAGGTTVSSLRQNLPSAADDIAGFKLRDMAAATAGKQNAVGEAISPQSFLTDWNKLSPEAKNALYADPTVRAKVDALAKVSDGIRSTAANLNTSHTQSAQAVHNIIRGLAMTGGAGVGAAIGHSVEPGVFGLLAGEGGAELAIPFLNRGASYAAANRPLAALMAARGGPLFYGQSPLTGAVAGLLNGPGSQSAGLLTGP